MTNDIFVFDRNIIRKNRNRSAAHISNYSFLIEWCSNQILERLSDIKREFSSILQIGCRHKIQLQPNNIIYCDIAENLNPNVHCNEELLPFSSNSFDLIISPMDLHSTNDLPGTLAQIKNCLKPDGLFIGTMLGGETLHELRTIMNRVEMELSNGQSPHVFPFADMQQMGSLMQRANFNLPVIDSEKITVTYDNAFKLMQDLRLMGEGNALIQRKKNFSSKAFFQNVAQEYQNLNSDSNGRIEATFEIIFLLGWAPHESQQKPLKPGSATNRLADVLNAKEEKLTC